MTYQNSVYVVYQDEKPVFLVSAYSKEHAETGARAFVKEGTSARVEMVRNAYHTSDSRYAILLHEL